MADEKQWTETGLEIAVVGMAGKFQARQILMSIGATFQRNRIGHSIYR